MTPNVRRILNDYSQQLMSLTVSECIDFFPTQLPSELLISAPKLRKLVLHSVHVECGQQLFSSLFRGFPNLTYLDLSDCNNVGEMSYLVNCPSLTVLILYNIVGLQDAIHHICKLSNLRYSLSFSLNNFVGIISFVTLSIADTWTCLKAVRFEEGLTKRMAPTKTPIKPWQLSLKVSRC